MTRTLTALVISTFVLSGCATVRDSRINPFNWFGQSQSVQSEEVEASSNPLIPQKRRFKRSRETQYAGTPIEVVSELVIERVPGGAIIRANGLAARQGSFEAQLTPANKDELPVDGVLTYSFDILRPAQLQPVGTERTREVTTARVLTNQQLAGVRTIRVEAAQNARESRR